MHSPQLDLQECLVRIHAWFRTREAIERRARSLRETVAGALLREPGIAPGALEGLRYRRLSLHPHASQPVIPPTSPPRPHTPTP